MKTKLILLMLFLSWSSFSQKVNKLKEPDTTKTYIIEYNFKSGRYKKALVKPIVDRPIVYKITNINRLAFDVKVNTADVVVAETDLYTSAEDLKKVTNLISEAKVNSNTSEDTKIEKLKISDKTPKIKKEEITKSINTIQNLDKLTYDLRKAENDLEIKKRDNYVLELKQSLFNDTITKTSDNQKDIESLAKEIDSLKAKIDKEEIKNEKLNKFYKAKEDFINNYYEFIKSFEKVDNIINSSNKVIPISKLPFLSKKEYDAKYRKEFIKIFAELINNQISQNTVNNNFTDLIVSYNRFKDFNNLTEILSETSLSAINSEINVLYDNIKDLKIRLDLIDFEKLSQQVQRIIHLLEKEDTYEFISAPIQPKNDIASFEIEIKSKNKDIEVDNSRKFIHNEFVRKGTRIDFSIGLAGSYFGNAKTYEIYTINGENKIGLKNERLIVPSLVTFLTMTKRSSEYIAFGGSAGLGVDITNGKIQMSNFFIGPTAVFGKYDRLMFTGGLALRNVGKLKSGYAIDSTIITQSNDINTVLSDDYKIGVFLAFTYNLTNNVRNKISKLK